MLWPERPDNWRLEAAPAQKAFTAVASAISIFEPLSMGVTAHQFEKARRLLPPRVDVVELPSNDAWMRDCGPTFVINGKGDVRLVDWQFNAWGGLYTDWTLDEVVPQKVAELEGVDYYCAPLILEGGSIHVDGEGTLLTTKECLLNNNVELPLFSETSQRLQQELQKDCPDLEGIEDLILHNRCLVRSALEPVADYFQMQFAHARLQPNSSRTGLKNTPKVVKFALAIKSSKAASRTIIHGKDMGKPDRTRLFLTLPSRPLTMSLGNIYFMFYLNNYGLRR
jgi:hypothetical protein